MIPFVTPLRPLCMSSYDGRRDRVRQVGAGARVRVAGDGPGHRRGRGRVVGPERRPAAREADRHPAPEVRRQAGRADARGRRRGTAPTDLAGAEHPERQPLGGRVVDLADGVGRVARVVRVHAAHRARSVDDERDIDQRRWLGPARALAGGRDHDLRVAVGDAHGAAEPERHADRAGHHERVAGVALGGVARRRADATRASPLGGSDRARVAGGRNVGHVGQAVVVPVADQAAEAEVDAAGVDAVRVVGARVAQGQGASPGAVGREARGPRERAAVEGVPQVLVGVAQDAEVDDDRREPQQHDDEEREQDDDLATLAVPGRPRARSLAEDPHHSIRIRTVEVIGIRLPKASGQIMW